MRRIIEAYAGEDGLHCTLSGVFPNSVEDTPGTHRHFNTLSPAQRVATARRELASAGVAGLAPLAQVRANRWGRAMALDAEAVGPAAPVRRTSPGQVTAEGVAILRGLLKRLRARKRRGADRDTRHDPENEVAADADLARAVRATRDYGYREIDKGSRMGRATRVMDSARPLDHTGRPMSDLEYFQRAAASTTGWY